MSGSDSGGHWSFEAVELVGEPQVGMTKQVTDTEK